MPNRDRSASMPGAPRPGLRAPALAGLLAVLVLAPAVGSGDAATPGSPPPNVIVVLADDLGYADVGFQGGGARTPHLDALAREGLRFLQFRLAAVSCSPSRASLLTGRFPQRTGVTRVLPTSSPEGLGPEEVTLGEFLAAHGYATGFIGKWHIGSNPGQTPWDRGYETRACVLYGRAPTYFEHDTHYGAELRHEKGYLTEVISREAVSFVREHAAGPFFLWIAHLAAHSPAEAPPERVAACLARLPEDLPEDVRRIRSAHDAMIEVMDDGVGQLLQTLEELHLDRRTLVIFLSDNGGLVGERRILCYPFLGGKGTLLEGGVRVPFVVRWPGHVPAGISEAPLTALDLFPTVCSACGLEPPSAPRLDGHDRLEWWQGATAAEPTTPLFITLENQRAVWYGPWKYLELSLGKLARQVPVLFDLRSTTSLDQAVLPATMLPLCLSAQRDAALDGRQGERFFELVDLADRYPERVAALRAAVDAFDQAMASDLPAPEVREEEEPGHPR